MADNPDRAAEFSSYTTRSVDEAHDAIAAHYYDLRLEVTGPPGDFVTGLGVVELGALTVGDVSFGTEVRMRFGEPGVYHLAIPLEGCFSVQEGSARPSIATTRGAVFFDPGQNIRVDAWSADCHVLSVKIDKAALLHQLELLLGGPPHRSPTFEPYVDVSEGAGRSWAQLALWCLREHELAGGLLHRPIVRGRIEQTLLEGVWLAARHSYRDELESPAPRMRPAAVKRVMDAVQELPTEPYDAARLAAIAQVSLRTLQQAFRTHVGVTPMAYVYEVRLQRVRAQLRTAAPGSTTVAAVAHQWGFVHLGRFARRYRERFGEPPSRTLRTG
ncbi:AraC family transcriptional regulator [Streptomyces sp. YU58]|uniref:AraC family transcriptional regulator n=1 Tax=Streptomyces sp. SX92 TaxID=3158972 RepID=UPI0027B8F598|nr:AraC family transcriptional regulator [Streptomyces coralus]WLW57469.1 AraC family transcriptional regulator [Streptomyces coralus]